MKNESEDKTRILGFDGVRALAVISVVLTHLSVYTWLQAQGGSFAGLVSSINGSAGVQVFFVLSGYLITHLLLAEYRSYGQISIYNFYVRRAFRIFPLYFLVLFLVLVMHLIGTGVTNYISLFFAFIYSYNFIPRGWYSGVLGHTWSLSVEEHFYLIWPFLLASFLPRYFFLLRILVIFFVVSFFLAVGLSEIDFLSRNFFIKRWSFIAGSSIAAGVILAVILGKNVLGDRVSAALRGWRPLVLSLILIFVEVFLYKAGAFFCQYVRVYSISRVVNK